MDERLFARLAARLEAEPVVVASVLATRGATPRKTGSRMLIGGRDIEFSIGGGMAEARVIAAARASLAGDARTSLLDIDLTGRAGSAGICGGSMRIALRCWDAADLPRARDIATRLREGRRTPLDAAEIGAGDGDFATPNVRLLMIGAGHCSLALYDLARHLDFDLGVFDSRRECFDGAQFPDARRYVGGYDCLDDAFASEREVYAVLLNRDYAADVASLRVLAPHAPAFLGMMGSRKRIGEVLAAVPDLADALHELQAPIGLEIEAHTPHEIAVSILAQLVRRRNTGA